MSTTPLQRLVADLTYCVVVILLCNEIRKLSDPKALPLAARPSFEKAMRKIHENIPMLLEAVITNADRDLPYELQEFIELITTSFSVVPSGPKAEQLPELDEDELYRVNHLYIFARCLTDITISKLQANEGDNKRS